ncbi:MAG: deoxyguanosinetriphosphate triphosphohydrolase [Pseudobdellovibrionaceae bacterium]
MSTATASNDTQAYNYCALPLASFATRPDQSKGRIHHEDESATRTCFQRDRDRIIHSSAFRRLKYKTQVFIYHEGDHYRTRLTHTLEVAQITRTLARALYVNEDLAEAIALAHDLGHTPFAHLGEYALQDCMEPYAGFDHNDQSLRCLTHLENKYPKWRGLNLTWETLEGVVKHNGPYSKKPLPETLADVQKHFDLRLDTYASIEAQVAALSDDIAYNNHDVEDGLRAGLFTLDDIAAVPLLGRHIAAARKNYPDISEKILVQEVIREMIGDMVSDVLAETRKRLAADKISTPEDVRMAGRAMVAFSKEMEDDVNLLREFLFARMYRHSSLNRLKYKVSRILTELFEAFMDAPDMLPENWQERLVESGGAENEMKKARIICDYIAGMTDRYAIREHEDIFKVALDVR